MLRGVRADGKTSAARARVSFVVRGLAFGGFPHHPGALSTHQRRKNLRTDLANLALLCGTHHTRVHQGWKLMQLHDGVWDARAP